MSFKEIMEEKLDEIKRIYDPHGSSRYDHYLGGCMSMAKWALEEYAREEHKSNVEMDFVNGPHYKPIKRSEEIKYHLKRLKELVEEGKKAKKEQK